MGLSLGVDALTAQLASLSASADMEEEGPVVGLVVNIGRFGRRGSCYAV
jgi:hypothetical protein